MIQLFFPLRCPVCDGIVRPFGEKICTECIPKLPPLSPPWCNRCGKKLLLEEGICSDCRSKKHYFVRGRSVYEYKGVAEAIYRFKYRNRKEYADFFGEETAKYLGDFLRKLRPDYLIPIPLHRKRFLKRGYNQAALLAEAIGNYTNIPVLSNGLIRKKNTVPLKLLKPQERQNNLENAFTIGKNDVKLRVNSKVIVLVDDIYTTGASVDEATKVLLQAGAKEVYFVTLASGTGV